VTGRHLAAASQALHNAVSLEVKASPDCTLNVRMPTGMEQSETDISLQSVVKYNRAA